MLQFHPLGTVEGWAGKRGKERREKVEGKADL